MPRPGSGVRLRLRNSAKVFSRSSRNIEAESSIGWEKVQANNSVTTLVALQVVVEWPAPILTPLHGQSLAYVR